MLLLIPGADSLALFSRLLTLQEAAAGRVHAPYGRVYFGVALTWLWLVDQVLPTACHLAGAAAALAGMGVIVFQPVGRAQHTSGAQ